MGMYQVRLTPNDRPVNLRTVEELSRFVTSGFLAVMNEHQPEQPNAYSAIFYTRRGVTLAKLVLPAHGWNVELVEQLEE